MDKTTAFNDLIVLRASLPGLVGAAVVPFVAFAGDVGGAAVVVLAEEFWLALGLQLFTTEIPAVSFFLQAWNAENVNRFSERTS